MATKRSSMTGTAAQTEGRHSEQLVAKSAPMRRVLELADRIAPSEATILITGESGTGKERLARHIHDHSKRSGGLFLAINCGALPESLLESELFGHVRGAFTGATGDKKGLFEAATGGTLFLDEIGETSPAVQVKLLRALQEHAVRPVGATKDIRIDARIVAATNRDLAKMVEDRTFRKDLYYRLRVVPLEVPPLRERRDDILPLARQFIGSVCSQNHCGPCSLKPKTLDVLVAYDWPGNVRELENAIERAVLLAEGQPAIEPGDLPPEVRGGPTAATSGANKTLAQVERQHILATLDRFAGNRKLTAKALDIGENTLWRKLTQYGIVKRRPPTEPTPVPSRVARPSRPKVQRRPASSRSRSAQRG